MTATALQIFGLPDGRRRALVRDDEGRLTLADLDDDGMAAPLFAPTSVDRLARFAVEAAIGTPAAVTHPKGHFFLAALALGLAALLEAQETTS